MILKRFSELKKGDLVVNCKSLRRKKEIIYGEVEAIKLKNLININKETGTIREKDKYGRNNGDGFISLGKNNMEGCCYILEEKDIKEIEEMKTKIKVCNALKDKKK